MKPDSQSSTNDEHKEVLRPEATELQRRLDEVWTRMMDRYTMYWKSVLGDQYEEALRDWRRARDLTSDSDPEVRRAALQILDIQHRPEEVAPILAEITKVLCIRDSSAIVRSDAIDVLAGLFADTRDEGIRQVLLNVINDPNECEDVREEARVMLLLVDGQNEAFREAFLRKRSGGDRE